jgi:hypothetical protein
VFQLSFTATAMTQGTSKGAARNKAASSRHAARAAAPKKGRKFIAPKKAVLIKQASLHKVNSQIAFISTKTHTQIPLL